MKTFESIEEGLWYELKEVQLTQEQEELLNSQNPEDIKAQSELVKLIQEEIKGKVSAEKAAELNAFYLNVKPELGQQDIYKLIEIDLTEEVGGVFRGILNCRVNGEHKQIRF